MAHAVADLLAEGRPVAERQESQRVGLDRLFLGTCDARQQRREQGDAREPARGADGGKT
jgi:hypothetical protein